MKESANMKKKGIATSFLVLASSGNVVEAYEKYVHPQFRHHNLYFKGGREALRKGMEENARAFPEKRYETIQALEDGDLVAVHGKVTLGPKIFGVIHIFRFQDGQIIESWEASQEQLADSPNEDGLF